MVDEVATLIFKAESGDLVKANAILKRTEQQGKKTEKASDGLAAGFKRLAVQVAAVGTAALALRKLTTSARSFDILSAKLKTATGSAENAEIAYQGILNLASKLPFGIEEVTQAFVKMRNLGLDPSEEAIMSYANTASAMGYSLNQMVEAVADATTGEFERLKEFGIKASSQGDRVSFTFQGVTTTIGKNAAEITRYLQDIGNVNFAGAAEDRAATLDGALSNLEDAWNNLWMSASQNGAGDEMQRQIRGLVELLQQPDTINAAQALANGMISAFTGISDAIVTTVNMAEWMGESIAAIANGVAADDLGRINQQIDEITALMADDSLFGKGKRLRFFGPDGLVEYYDDQELAEALQELQAQRDRLLEGNDPVFTIKPPPGATQTEPGVLGQFKVNPTGESGGGGGSVTAKRERELDQLRRSLMTEQELEADNFAKKIEQIRSFEEEKAITQEEARQMEQEAARAHWEKMNELEAEAWNERYAWAEYGLDIAAKYYEGMEGKEAAWMRAAIQGAKILADAKKREALKNTLVKGYEGIQEAVASNPFPINVPAIAFATAQMGANLAGIAGARALGGQALPGESYLVGERGPEIFTPGSLGHVMSAEKANQDAGGGSSQEIHHHYAVNVQAIDTQTGLDFVLNNRGAIVTALNEDRADRGEAPI